MTPHHDGSERYVSSPAPRLGETVTVFVRAARQPMPWARPASWDTVTLRRYRELIGLRRAAPALRWGGLRWLPAAGDTLAFLRESTGQSVLVVARRAAGEPLRIPGVPAENLYGGAGPLYTEQDGSTLIDGDGPTVQIWEVRK